VTHVTPPKGVLQKKMRVQARHKPVCVPGSELACVELASQIGALQAWLALFCRPLLRAASNWVTSLWLLHG